jgi:hypothetical protein
MSPKLAARITIVSAVAFIVILALLHFTEPEFDPSWRLISEYELGKYGWLMRVAFFSMALASVGLFIAVRSQIRGVLGSVGLALLLVIAVGVIIGGIFTTDPITAPANTRSTTGALHGLGGALSFPLIPIAALLTSLSLVRRNQAWVSARPTLLWTTALIWLSLAAFIAITVIQYQPVPGPDLMWGWPNRAVVVAYCIWLIFVARHAMKVAQETSAA